MIHVFPSCRKTSCSDGGLALFKSSLSLSPSLPHSLSPSLPLSFALPPALSLSRKASHVQSIPSSPLAESVRMHLFEPTSILPASPHTPLFLLPHQEHVLDALAQTGVTIEGWMRVGKEGREGTAGGQGGGKRVGEGGQGGGKGGGMARHEGEGRRRISIRPRLVVWKWFSFREQLGEWFVGRRLCVLQAPTFGQ